MSIPVFQTNFPTLELVRRGKVRDVYNLDEALLIVATDRISAFDVIMNEPISGKGAILTQLSTFWFDKTRHIVPNHILKTDCSEYPDELQPYRQELEGRSMMVVKTQPLAIECVVRGYLAGSGWKEYQQSQTVCGIALPAGLVESSPLPEPIFTPATKAEEGHDENITFEQAIDIVGNSIAHRVRDISIALYTFAHEFAAEKGIILADTKFEFGVTHGGELILIDEALTPDSSRYWLKDSYKPGHAQMNFDKQVLRDWLELQDWNKQSPAPTLPRNVIQATLEKYQEALTRLTT